MDSDGQTRVQFTMTDGQVYDFWLTDAEMYQLERTMEREVRWLKVEKDCPTMYLNMRHCTAVCVFETEGE